MFDAKLFQILIKFFSAEFQDAKIRLSAFLAFYKICAIEIILIDFRKKNPKKSKKPQNRLKSHP